MSYICKLLRQKPRSYLIDEQVCKQSKLALEMLFLKVKKITLKKTSFVLEPLGKKVKFEQKKRFRGISIKFCQNAISNGIR